VRWVEEAERNGLYLNADSMHDLTSVAHNEAALFISRYEHDSIVNARIKLRNRKHESGRRFQFENECSTLLKQIRTCERLTTGLPASSFWWKTKGRSLMKTNLQRRRIRRAFSSSFMSSSSNRSTALNAKLIRPSVS
jgi:hypothetical protein